jgi:bile acid-coenzyme A ligase
MMSKMPVAKLLRYWAERKRDLPAITAPEEAITWTALDRRTNQIARAYEELGVLPDRLVTIALPNGIAFLEAAIATLKIGATPQPLSAKLSEPEMAAIVELARPAAIVAEYNYAFGCRVISPEGIRVESFSDSGLPDKVASAWKAPASGGSTGRPKIILAASPALFDPETPVQRMEVAGTILIPGPLYHNGPFISALHGLFTGNHVVIMSRFDAQRRWNLSIDTGSIGWRLFRR